MFESILIRRHEDVPKLIDPGRIAEALLFYQSVHLLLDRQSLHALLSKIGVENLLRLIEDGFAKGTFLPSISGVYTDGTAGFDVHSFTLFRAGWKVRRNMVDVEDQVSDTFQQLMGKSRRTKRLITRFLDVVPLRGKHALDPYEIDIPKLALNDLSDRDYVQATIEETLRHYAPTYSPPRDLKIDIIDLGDNKFLASTNIDFQEVNRRYLENRGDPSTTVSLALALREILDARADISFSADYMTELDMDGLRSKIVRKKFTNLVRRHLRNVGEIELFEDTTLDNSRAIAEAINSGERQFGDLFPLLGRAGKFKQWIATQNPDKSLLEAYLDAATGGTWAEGLPYKRAKFAFCIAAIGLEALLPTGLGIATAVGLQAADSLIVDKYVKGWRPSHFVEGPLQAFVKPPSPRRE